VLSPCCEESLYMIFSVNADVMTDLSPVALISAVMEVFASCTATAANFCWLSRPFAVCVAGGVRVRMEDDVLHVLRIYSHMVNLVPTSGSRFTAPLARSVPPSPSTWLKNSFTIKISISAVLWVLSYLTDRPQLAISGSTFSIIMLTSTGVKWLYRQLFFSHSTLPTAVLVTHARLTSLVLTTQDWSQTTALTTDSSHCDWYKRNYSFSPNARKMKWSLILDRRNQTTHQSWSSRVLIRWTNIVIKG